MSKSVKFFIIAGILLAAGLAKSPAEMMNPPSSENIDERVRQFLDNHRWSWGSWGGGSVPEVDGQALYSI